MDEERIPKELNNKILIGLTIVLIQSVLFIHFVKSSLILFVGIIIFMLMFSMRDKQMKKDSLNKILTQKDWYNSKYNLSKEIP